jgi:hypothetical protein
MRGIHLKLNVTLSVLVLAGACAHGGSPPTASVAESVVAHQPLCDLERQEHLSLGGLKLSAVKALIKLADEDEAAKILAGIKRVEMATYAVSGPEPCMDPSSLGPIETALHQQGWSLTVREQDEGDSTWVFMREDDNGSIDGLYVITFDRREMEIVRLEGRIDEMLAEAIAETPSKAGEIVSAEF